MKKLLLASTSLLATIGLTGAANAAGFYIQEQSVSGLGTSYAGQAAMPRDASIIFFNPAGITHLDGRQLNVGVHFIYPHTDLEDTGTTIGGTTLDALGRDNGSGGNPGSLSEIPNFYFATPLNDSKSWWAGFGVSAPFGLGTEYNEDFFGRYLSTKAEIRTVDFHPTLAYQPNDWFSIGGSLVVETLRANFQQRLFNEDFVRLQGDDLSFGYNLGMMIEPIEGTRLGLSYRSEINHDVSGEQSTAQGTLGVDTTANAKVKIPDIATVAIAQEIDNKFTLLGQAFYTGWNTFDVLEVRPDSALAQGPVIAFNYQDTWSYSLGLEYKHSDTWTFRTGYQYDATPTTDSGRSTINPDGDRDWYSVGATYTMNDRFSFDFAGTYIDIEEETINQTRAGGVNVRAKANDAYVWIGAVALNYKF